MTPLAFLLDLDGTLIDSRRSIATACNVALERVGRARLPEDEIAGYVGYGVRSLVVSALHEEGKTNPSLIEAMLAEFIAYYAAHPIDGTTWMPGAREALETLRGTVGAKIGLVTNKARAVTVPILQALEIADRFDVVVAGGDAPLKPDPAPIAMALRAVGAEAARTWVIGDGIQDVRGGRAAGCRTAAVLGGFHAEARLRAEKPDVVLASLLEIGTLLTPDSAT